MASQQTFTGPKRVPVCVYLIFHPQSPEARRLADWVFDWLRLDGSSTIAGLPVYYRAHLEKGAIAPAIEFAGATHNFVVPLVDDHLATDPHWRAALKALVDKKAPLPAGVRKHVLPVMVDKSFDQLAFLAVPFNPVRIFAADDPPVPSAHLRGEALDAAWKPRLRARGARLRRRLTESMVRAMRSADDHDQVPRLKVFVSHAKADGEDIARCIRDELASVSQLEAWFDVNDLSAGRPARRAMSHAAALSTGGMIAVITSAYATRPWCRHEARQARKPVRVKVRGKVMFAVQPTVAVQGLMTQWSRAVGPLAQVHRIGWSPAGARQQVAELVDRLLLETLLADTNRQLIASLPKSDVERRVFLDFVPDAWSLAELRALTAAADLGKQIVYPGHRLSRAEHEELQSVVTAVFGGKASLEALESLALPAAERGKKSLRVALSAGGDCDDLYKAGVGLRHANDLMVRLSRALLEAGYRLSFGGTLTHPNNLTTALLAAGEGWRADLAFKLDERDNVRIRKQNRALRQPPIRNYAGWPHSEELTTSKRAEHLGLCDFIKVYPDGTDTASPADLERWKANSAREEAVTMRAMRERMAAESDLRVLFAGKIHGARGWLPGIAEELVTTLKAGKPYLILGGFGGCAALLAEFLLGSRKEWPHALTFEGELERRQRSREWKDAEWLRVVSAEEWRLRYEELRDLVRQERDAMANQRTHRGIRLDAWQKAARSQSSATETIAMVLQVVAQLSARSP